VNLLAYLLFAAGRHAVFWGRPPTQRSTRVHMELCWVAREKHNVS